MTTNKANEQTIRTLKRKIFETTFVSVSSCTLLVLHGSLSEECVVSLPKLTYPENELRKV